MKKFRGLFTNFRLRKRLLALSDAFIIVVAGLLANFPIPVYASRIGRPDLFAFLSTCVICCFATLLLFGAYNRLWRYFDRNDYLNCVKGVVAGYAVAVGLYFVFTHTVYCRFSLLTCALSVAGVCAFRYLIKDAFATLVETGRKDAAYKRTMIIGAGRAGKLLLTEIANRGLGEPGDGGKRGERSKILPVCVIDDDRSKIGRRFCGILVAGATSDIGKIAKIENVEQIIFAIPSCPPKDRAAILKICNKTGLPVKVLPFIGSALGDSMYNESGRSFASQIRDINVEDLLGREPVKFDNKDVRDFIEGKVCMVTGGGGSIGSELVRQIAKYAPRQLIVVDIYENNAYEIQQEMVMEYGDSLNLVTLIASVRDYQRMSHIFKTYKPDVVFHAAAHKHVPLMENSPMEAIKNNVIGTFNVAFLSLFNKVGKFVMISTDKAVNPTNVMGASKRCCEMIVQYLAQQKASTTEFVCTRFGNVLGSNGSVIPLFKKQIEQGKPVTVTHPDIIRYFMTIPEAVSLVMEAASIAKGGEIFVLDMGQPVKIVTLAENLIRMYGKVPYTDVEIKFTGLRPGEKIREELLMNEEGLEKTRNKLIFIGKQLEIDGDHFIKQLWNLKNSAEKNDDAEAIRALHEIVPTFTTPEQYNSKAISNFGSPT
ncbi:polysaccharide biosynthesis protein [Fibrobacter sp.]|uniref:polysaccharide biosynthesis protein n=1 Tax=Fibrobacter sp. TaxID=35828 RepID=UPI00386E381F